MPRWWGGHSSSPRSQAANVVCCDGNPPLMDALPWGPLGALQHKVLVVKKAGLAL